MVAAELQIVLMLLIGSVGVALWGWLVERILSTLGRVDKAWRKLKR